MLWVQLRKKKEKVWNYKRSWLIQGPRVVSDWTAQRRVGRRERRGCRGGREHLETAQLLPRGAGAPSLYLRVALSL